VIWNEEVSAARKCSDGVWTYHKNLPAIPFFRKSKVAWPRGVQGVQKAISTRFCRRIWSFLIPRHIPKIRCFRKIEIFRYNRYKFTPDRPPQPATVPINSALPKSTIAPDRRLMTILAAMTPGRRRREAKVSVLPTESIVPPPIFRSEADLPLQAISAVPADKTEYWAVLASALRPRREHS
jgi:hypothetical protein